MRPSKPQSKSQQDNISKDLYGIIYGYLKAAEPLDCWEAYDEAINPILALINQARIEEVQSFESELVCRDNVLNEKPILNAILEYSSDRIAELRDKE